MKVGENMGILGPVLVEDSSMVKRNGGDVTLPTPRTRFEKLLYICAGGTIERPTPKTVEERLLDYICDRLDDITDTSGQEIQSAVNTYLDEHGVTINIEAATNSDIEEAMNNA